MSTQTPQPTDQASRRTSGIGALELLTVALVALLLGQRWIAAWFDDLPALQTWTTVFVSIIVQALPFLVLGVLLSAAISAFVPPEFFARALPKSPAAAVPVAASAGVILPGCECASVPVAGGLVARGVAPAAAFAFLLSAPAINPIVLASTAVAFPGQPEMVFGRFVASCMRAGSSSSAASRLPCSTSPCLSRGWMRSPTSRCCRCCSSLSSRSAWRSARRPTHSSQPASRSSR